MQKVIIKDYPAEDLVLKENLLALQKNLIVLIVQNPIIKILHRKVIIVLVIIIIIIIQILILLIALLKIIILQIIVTITITSITIIDIIITFSQEDFSLEEEIDFFIDHFILDLSLAV